jgi:alpha-methylacyl-CoA racemase
MTVPPAPTAAAPGPLDGVRVLDLGTIGPGARACRILGDLGADVVRLGPPAAREYPLPFYAYGGMRGFRRCRVDLGTAAGRQVALDLAATADVVIEGFRPGVAARLGVGFDDVSAVNASVVYCSATAYGQDGERAGWAGHDLNYLAIAGWLSTSEPAEGGRPPLPGATVADAAGGGMQAALAVLAALVGRPRRAGAVHLDVSATDGMLGVMAMHLENHLGTGADVRPGSDVLTGAYACYGVYACADGRWLSVAAVEPRFFANLCSRLGRPELAARQYDDAAQHELRAALAELLATRDRDAWVAELAARDTCVAPVLTLAEVVADADLAARGRFLDAVHPTRGAVRQLGPVVAGAPRPAEPIPLPDPGRTDTDALLAALGYPSQRITELRTAGVVE